MITPWGVPTSMIELEPGIVFVLTEEHGGLVLIEEYAGKKLSYPARKRALRFGDNYTYEMNCAWALVLWELPYLRELLKVKADFNLDALPERNLTSILTRYFLDYLQEYRSLKSYALCRP